jgi:RHS repeat-associated protein
VFVPQTQEQFGYDLDGNLTSDGRWTYAWDAENRLIQMVARTSVGPQQIIKFEYDSQGRRIHKQVWNNTAGTGNPALDQRFLYDGWNLITILNPQSSLIESFMWGSDLSGSMQGAGGVGGLLEVSYYGTTTTNCFPAFDGNGNVMALVNAADGMAAANYDYGPFGEVIRTTGAMAQADPYRFSTKYQDDESDLLYYGYRYFRPSIGSWLSRDPMEEQGGHNLYGFVGNDPAQRVDLLGLEWSVLRFGGARAIAICQCGDTWGGLARKINFDTSDYKTWAQTADAQPVPFKPYSVPNVIYMDNGDAKPSDIWPTSILHIWRSIYRHDMQRLQLQGFQVFWNEGVTDNEIMAHLGSADIYAYVFTGHGYTDGIINSYSHLGPDVSGVGPGRYTLYGIASLELNSCDSADSVPIIRHHYTYNAWESNVSTRGWFKGYQGSVNTFSELFKWVIAQGKNDHPFQVPK